MEKRNIEDLPCFEMSIDPINQGFVYAVAVTDDPAHQSMYLSFTKDSVRHDFTTDDIKQEIFGAAIIPGKKIVRAPNKLVNDYHTVVFSAEQIRLMAEEFFNQGFQKNINMNHTDVAIEGNFFQSIIIGDGIGEGKVNGLDLPAGTWVLGAKIHDLNTFNKVKKYGFSVEGLFNYTPVKNSFKSDVEQLEIELKKLVENLNEA